MVFLVYLFHIEVRLSTVRLVTRDVHLPRGFNVGPFLSLFLHYDGRTTSRFRVSVDPTMTCRYGLPHEPLPSLQGPPGLGVTFLDSTKCQGFRPIYESVLSLLEEMEKGLWRWELTCPE